MRVLVPYDRTERLDPAGTFNVVAGAFAGRGAQVAVAPISGGGEGLAEVLVRFSPGARVLAVESLRQARDMLAESLDYLDVTAVTTPELRELLELPAIPAHTGTTIVVPHRETRHTLTGLAGLLAERGRETGAGIAAVLAEDSRAAAWLGRLGVTDRAFAGALCGLGARALGYGVWVASGIRIHVDGYWLPELAAKADMIVTGTDMLDLHRRDGDVAAELTHLGVEAPRPVVAVTGRSSVSSRKLRLAGIEEAHAVTPPGVGEIDITAEQLEALAQRVAGTWTW